LQPIGRQRRDAGRDHLSRPRVAGQRAASDADRAIADVQGAAKHLGKFPDARLGQAHDPDDLSAVDPKREIMQLQALNVIQLKRRSAEGRPFIPPDSLRPPQLLQGTRRRQGLGSRSVGIA
jgi:hypothetical protein